MTKYSEDDVKQSPSEPENNTTLQHASSRMPN